MTLKIDGIDWTESAEEQKAEAIEMWWDRHLKLWTLYPVDGNGYQLEGATYATNKNEAIEKKQELKTQYGL